MQNALVRKIQQIVCSKQPRAVINLSQFQSQTMIMMMNKHAKKEWCTKTFKPELCLWQLSACVLF